MTLIVKSSVSVLAGLSVTRPEPGMSERRQPTTQGMTDSRHSASSVHARRG